QAPERRIGVRGTDSNGQRFFRVPDFTGRLNAGHPLSRGRQRAHRVTYVDGLRGAGTANNSLGSTPSAAARRLAVVQVRSRVRPFSSREITGCFTPERSANSCWVSPLILRAVFSVMGTSGNLSF